MFVRCSRSSLKVNKLKPVINNKSSDESLAGQDHLESEGLTKITEQIQKASSDNFFICSIKTYL